MAFALMKFKAKQLRASEDALPDAAADPVQAPVYRGGPVFTAQDLQEPDKDESEEVYGGILIIVLRIRTTVPQTLTSAQHPTV